MFSRSTSYSYLDDDIVESTEKSSLLSGYVSSSSNQSITDAHYPAVQAPNQQYFPSPRPSHYLPQAMPFVPPTPTVPSTPPQRGFSFTDTLSKIRKLVTDESDFLVPTDFAGNPEPVREGSGTFIWDNGDRYEGNWRNNQKHGYGIMRWKSGDVYQGNWVDDKRQDERAIYMYSYGLVYEGGYENDCRHGQGCLMWPDGERYIGTWNKGARVGKGIFITSAGIQMEQEWTESPNVNYSESSPAKFPPRVITPFSFS